MTRRYKPGQGTQAVSCRVLPGSGVHGREGLPEGRGWRYSEQLLRMNCRRGEVEVMEAKVGVGNLVFHLS